MDLNTLRADIDSIDSQILKLFVERMDVCRKVGEYKKANNIPVMQGGREAQVLDRIRSNSPEGLGDGAALLFQNIMDISKCLQNIEMSEGAPAKEYKAFEPSKAERIACQGTKGSYQEVACKKLFGDKPVAFYGSFEEVFAAVERGDVDYGLLPLENTTIGSVTETYDLMANHDFYINSLVRVEITHCLAAKKGTALSDIKKVYSKAEALSQCSEFLKEHELEQCEYANTALAAELVLKSEENIACICSESCAQLYGLEIISARIADAYPNFTRFICFSKGLTVNPDDDIVSVLITIPHVKGSLNRLLTKFAVNGLNLLKIESKSIAGSDFEVMFYLDFQGNCRNERVESLIENLSAEMTYFRFLGNFREIM